MSDEGIAAAAAVETTTVPPAAVLHLTSHTNRITATTTIAVRLPLRRPDGIVSLRYAAETTATTTSTLPRLLALGIAGRDVGPWSPIPAAPRAGLATSSRLATSRGRNRRCPSGRLRRGSRTSRRMRVRSGGEGSARRGSASVSGIAKTESVGMGAVVVGTGMSVSVVVTAMAIESGVVATATATVTTIESEVPATATPAITTAATAARDHAAPTAPTAPTATPVAHAAHRHDVKSPRVGMAWKSDHRQRRTSTPTLTRPLTRPRRTTKLARNSPAQKTAKSSTRARTARRCSPAKARPWRPTCKTANVSRAEARLVFLQSKLKTSRKQALSCLVLAMRE